MFTATLKINQSFLRVAFFLLLTIVALGVWAQPTFNSATVDNANPTRVVVQFNLDAFGNMLGSTALTDFTVNVSGNPVTIASFNILDVDGVPADEVWLNLANPVPGGETVTVSFNDASSDIRQYVGTSGISNLATFGAQTVTNSVNPTTVTAPSLANICSGTNSYFDLGNIVINEVEVHNFSTGTDVTLELDAPTNFEFQAGVGSVGYTGTDITAASIGVTSTKITVTYTVGSVADVNSLTISGIKVKATAVSSSGSILRTGGTAVQGGNKVADAVVHASLSSDANACPEVTTYSPAKLATGVTISDNIVLTFNTNVVSGGSGNITITPISPMGADIVIPITDPQVTIGGGSNIVTVNPSSDLAIGTQYEVKVDQGAIVGDGTSAPFVGIVAGEWTFTTADIALTLTSTSPVVNAVDVVQSTNIVLTYSTNIGVGTGNITIRNLETNTDIFDAPANDAQITIVGNILTIDLSANLDPNTEYRIRMPAGAITRLSDGSAGPSITGSNFTFKTDINLGMEN